MVPLIWTLILIDSFEPVKLMVAASAQLDLDVIYIQAKRWENPVGRPEVQAFAGSLEGFRAKKGVFITTSRFTKEAREYVDKIASRIILIEGQQLAELMIDFNVGTSDYERYVVKKLDVDYFEED